jgi:hypothetical protein
MRKLSKKEAQAYELRLKVWNDLPVVTGIMKEINNIAELYAVSEGKLKFWRETYIGMSCAHFTHALKFRLGGDPPDFELDYGSHQRSFEIVQLVPQGRLISGEHKTYAQDLEAKGETILREDTYATRRSEWEAVVPDAKIQVAAKASKSYPPETILVVDIVHDFEFQQDPGATRQLVSLAMQNTSHFSEIWFRKSRSLLRVSSTSATLIKPPWYIED